MEVNTPEFQDTVRNKITGATGVVIAKYHDTLVKPKNKSEILGWSIDVRLISNPGETTRDVWYDSPIDKWEVIRKYEGNVEK